LSTPPRQSRRAFLRISGLAALGATLSACAAPLGRLNMPAELAVTGPDDALQRLVAGNQRYASNQSTDLNESIARRAAVAGGQSPFATVFSCVDSRVPPELVFDRGIGDLFVIRTAGHVLDHAVLGSLEFGVAELKIPLLLVMGHQKCGAVKATIEAVEQHASAPADIQTLVEAITPAVEQSHGQAGDALDNAVHANVALTVAKLRGLPSFAEAIGQGRLKIAGACYDLDSGLVELMQV